MNFYPFRNGSIGAYGPDKSSLFLCKNCWNRSSFYRIRTIFSLSCNRPFRLLWPQNRKKRGSVTMPKDVIHKVYTGKNIRSVFFSCRVRTQFFCRVNGPYGPDKSSLFLCKNCWNRSSFCRIRTIFALSCKRPLNVHLQGLVSDFAESKSLKFYRYTRIYFSLERTMLLSFQHVLGQFM